MYIDSYVVSWSHISVLTRDNTVLLHEHTKNNQDFSLVVGLAHYNNLPLPKRILYPNSYGLCVPMNLLYINVSQQDYTGFSLLYTYTEKQFSKYS